MSASSTRAVVKSLRFPLGLSWAVAVGATFSVTPARASLGGANVGQAPASDHGFDDPKLMREGLVPRSVSGRVPPALAVPQPVIKPAPLVPPPVTVAKPGVTPTPVVAAKPVTAVAAAKPVTPLATAKPAAPVATVKPAALPPPVVAPPPVAVRLPVRRLALADTSPVESSSSVAVASARPRDEAPAAIKESSSSPWPYAPRMKLSYRRFAFARAASAAPSITPGVLDPNRPESLESLALDFYPVSWYLRMGLSTQFGWESGQFDRSGDYFVAESVSLGLQLPGRITPFVEGFAGAGYMRRMQANGAMPSAYWQVGVDAGVEVYFAARAYVSLAVGYLRPGNLFLMDQNLQSVKLDTWALKVGLGI